MVPAKLIINTTYVLMHKNIKFLAPLVSTIIARAVAQVAFNYFYKNTSNEYEYKLFSNYDFTKRYIAETFCNAISTASVMHHYSHLRFYNSTSALNNSAHLAFFRGVCAPVANDLGRKLGDLFNGPEIPVYPFLNLNHFVSSSNIFSCSQFSKYYVLQLTGSHFLAGCSRTAFLKLCSFTLKHKITLGNAITSSVFEGISLSFYPKTKDVFQNLAFSVMGTAGDSTNLLAKFLQTSAIECATVYLSPSRGGNHLVSIGKDIANLGGKTIGNSIKYLGYSINGFATEVGKSLGI